MIRALKFFIFKIFFRKRLINKANLIKTRIEILDALLIARKNSDRIKEIKANIRLPYGQLEEEFGFNYLQARSIMEIKKDLCEISEKNIIDEKDNLRNEYIELEQFII